MTTSSWSYCDVVTPHKGYRYIQKGVVKGVVCAEWCSISSPLARSHTKYVSNFRDQEEAFQNRQRSGIFFDTNIVISKFHSEEKVLRANFVLPWKVYLPWTYSKALSLIAVTIADQTSQFIKEETPRPAHLTLSMWTTRLKLERCFQVILMKI